LVRFVGGVEVADYLDIIAPAYLMREAWSALLDYLLQHRTDWDALDLHSLPEFSPSREALTSLAAEKGLGIEVVPEDVCPLIELPGDWETYLMGLRKKDRHELRRKVRKLEGRDDARWYLVRTDDPGELERGMRAFIDLHRSSGLDKAQFMDERRAEAFMQMAAHMSRSGWLDLAVLSVHDEPAAAYLSFNYHGRLYLYNSGYDPKFAAYSAGVALLAYRIHKAILQGVKTFDFLRGDEEYKYDFGAKDTYVYRAVLQVVSGQ
jgi:CelD/BcsL family acetyltransferase involved in cellulose biosynthesis